MSQKSNLALSCGLLVLLGSAALAHGPAAWIMNGPYYAILNNQPDVHCCGPSDCEMWPEEDVEATPQGYHLKSTGETIPYSKVYYTEPEAAERSRFWRCHTYEVLPKYKADASQVGLPSYKYRSRCFFAPGGQT